MKRGVFTITVANLASKPLGLLRQMAFASFYGVTAIMSACRFAQTMTLAFMNFFTADTLNAGFLPLYQRYKQESNELAVSYFWCLFVLILGLSSAVSGILFGASGPIVHWFAPGFDQSVAEQAVLFMRVFALAVPFCLLGTLFSYLAMSDEAYAGVALRPMFESIGLIAGVFASVWWQHFEYIAWGFVTAYVLFFMFVVVLCWNRGLLQTVPLANFLQNSRRLSLAFWQTVRPLMILPFFMQGKFVIEKMIASLIAVSVVASLDYARFVIETGINVIATPLGLVGLSSFALLDGQKLKEKLDDVLSLLFLASVPITLFLLVNSELVIRLLYGYGAFNALAVQQSSVILMTMGLAFFAQVIAYVLMKVLSAKLQNRRVMYYMLFALSVNIAFIVLFYQWLGPMVLGLGESLYALTLFVLGARYFKLFPLFQGLALIVAPLAIFYVIFARYLSLGSSFAVWQLMLLQLLWFVGFWGAALMAVTKTRILILSQVKNW